MMPYNMQDKAGLLKRKHRCRREIAAAVYDVSDQDAHWLNGI